MRNLIVDETIKLITEFKENDEFSAFIDKYKTDYNLYKMTDYKYENGKLYRHAQAGWFEEPIKPVRVIGNYKIFAVHIDCTMPYTRYYLVNTLSCDVYTFESAQIDGWNGTLKKLVNDINLVIQGEYTQSLKPKQFDFDITKGI